MKKFQYEMPETSQQAAELGKKPDAVFMAGGTDLLGVLKDGLLPRYPKTVVNLKELPGMKGIEKKDDGLHIGAMATLAEVAKSPVVKEGWAALADAAYSVATPNLRNTATVGGNICQDIRCWYYRYPDVLGGKINCARKEGRLCSAMMGENRYHSIFGAAKVTRSACQNECPAKTDIPAYMEQMRAGDIDAAARIILEVNPMPALTSRVCAHFCMEQCVRNNYDEALNVGSVERYLGDYILENPGKYMVAPAAENGKSVAIVGSGPAGLTAAYYLRQAGYAVTVYEKQKEAGGCLTYAIPAYRLPKDLVKKFVASLQGMGITIKTGTEVGKDVTVEELKKANDSVMLDTGTWQRPLIGLSGEELTRFGLEFLIDVNNYILERPGQNVVVVGGGNVAMDVAITAKRLGSPKVTMVCLEQRDSMPANQEEIDRALEENVEIVNGWGPNKVLKDETGRVKGLEFKHCPSVLDETGRFNPTYDENKLMVQDADIIMMAIGQKADLAFLEGEYKVESERGRIKASGDYETSVPGIFAAGDVTTGPATVIAAIAAGKGTAKGINKYNGGGPLPVEVVESQRKQLPLLSFADECHNCRERQNPELLPIEERDMVKEDMGGLSEEETGKEILRCFNCGCLAVNPSDMANMLYALNAKVVTNKRTLTAAEFFGASTWVKAVLQRGEFVTELVVPALPQNAVARYDKYRIRKSIDFAVLAVASVYQVENGQVKDASLVLGAVAPMPLKRTEAEEFLRGKTLSEDVARQAGEIALKGSLPLERNEYKIDMAKVMVKRSLGY